MTTRYGASHQNAKLSDEDVQQLLAERASGISLRKLAAKFEISLTQTARIARGERWGHAQHLEDAELQPLRVCPDPLPELQPRGPNECAGARAFVLMAAALQTRAGSI